MSEDEVVSLVLYTMEAVPREESLYYMMNAALRGKDRSGVSERVTACVTKAGDSGRCEKH